MHYPMPEGWRHAAEREIARREEVLAATQARELARFQELLRANLEAQGLTVTRQSGLNVDVTYPVGTAVADDWYERARFEAFATMATERGEAGR